MGKALTSKFFEAPCINEHDDSSSLEKLVESLDLFISQSKNTFYINDESAMTFVAYLIDLTIVPINRAT